MKTLRTKFKDKMTQEKVIKIIFIIINHFFCLNYFNYYKELYFISVKYVVFT